MRGITTREKKIPLEPESPKVSEKKRIQRLEKVCIVLCVAVILLALSVVHLTGTVSRVVGIFQLLTEQISFITQQIDTIYAQILSPA